MRKAKTKRSVEMDRIYIAAVEGKAYCFNHEDSLTRFVEALVEKGTKVDLVDYHPGVFENCQLAIISLLADIKMREAYKDLDGALDGYYERMPNPYPEPEEFI
jgi:hypothetical protein